jgi:hypothetical protein
VLLTQSTGRFFKLSALISFLAIGGCIIAAPHTASNLAITEQLTVQILDQQDIEFSLLNNVPTQLHETSGLAQHKGRYWSINDSGDSASIYRLSDDLTTIDKTMSLSNGVNKDWESMASDESTLIIADCGNNSGNRRVFQLYHLPWSMLEQAKDGSALPASVQHFSYADQPQQNVPYRHNFDCEAVTIVNDSLWLFSKNWQDGFTQLYQLALDKPNQITSPVTRINMKGLVTGADFNKDTQTLALVGYSQQQLFGFAFVWLFNVSNNSINPSTARYFELPYYAQWEGIVWQDATTLMLSTEQSPLTKSQLARLSLKK